MKDGRCLFHGLLHNVSSPFGVEKKNIIKDEANKTTDESDDDQFFCCTRGLEEHTKSYMNRKKILNGMLLSTIQSIQRLKELDPQPQTTAAQFRRNNATSNNVSEDVHELIGNLCRKFSATCVEEAITRAKEDEKEAVAAMKARAQ